METIKVFVQVLFADRDTFLGGLFGALDVPRDIAKHHLTARILREAWQRGCNPGGDASVRAVELSPKGWAHIAEIAPPLWKLLNLDQMNEVDDRFASVAKSAALEAN